MEWTDEGMLLSVRKHGEGAAIIEVLTKNHGRHAGVVRGGGARKSAALLQPGAQLAVRWRARLAEHLGSFSVEPKFSRVTEIMAGRREIAAFAAISGLVLTCLPEREPQGAIYAKVMALMEDFSIDSAWLAKYIRWELLMLDELGFGLDLAGCAVTGTNDNLAYVSPKTGRAVSSAAAVGWEDRLLKLPVFLTDPEFHLPSNESIMQGLVLSGYFLKSGILASDGRKEMPQARDRFVAVLNGQSGQ